jgi:hypothetical protein
MSLSDLASLGSFVSGAAVLASLVFLYFQIRQVNAQVLQTERNQRALLQQGRAARAAGTLLQAAASPSLANAIQRVLSGDRDLPRTEFFQFWHWASATITGVEDTYFQYRHGMHEDEVFELTVGQMRRILSPEAFQAAWRVMRGSRTAEFRDFVDRLAEDAAAAPYGDVYELWKAEMERERDPRPTAA